MAPAHDACRSRPPFAWHALPLLGFAALFGVACGGGGPGTGAEVFRYEDVLAPVAATITLPTCRTPGEALEANFSTGLGIGLGAPDPSWRLVHEPTNGVVALTPRRVDLAGFGSWAAPNLATGANWIQPPANLVTGSNANLATPRAYASGEFVYRLAFFLPLALSQPVISGRVAGDNLVDVRLNGLGGPLIYSCTAPTGCHASILPFTTTGTGFLPGAINWLDVIVDNADSFTGTCVEATFRATCCTAPPPGMVAWYPLDEQTGALSVHDVIGTDNVGSLIKFDFLGNPIPGDPILPAPFRVGAATGTVAGGLYFGGGAIEVPDHPDLAFGAGDFAVDAWVRPVAAQPGFGHPIVDKHAPAAGFALGLRDGLPELWLNGVAYAPSSGSLPPAPAATWSHVALSLERATGVATFWVNGASATVNGVPPAGSVTNALPLWIGRSRGLFTMEVTLDELEIFATTLSDGDVQRLVAAGSVGKCRDPHLTVRVYQDDDANGAWSVTEPGLLAWTVDVRNAGTNALVAQGTTAGPDGSVGFELPPDTYVVSLVLQAGYALTQPGGAGTYTITLGPSGTSSLVFGAKP